MRSAHTGASHARNARLIGFYFDLDLDGVRPTVECDGERVSPHLAAFHRWHNSDHVNRGWGERGPMEKHRAYIRGLMADPSTLPIMMSWDGELMGYCEMVWTKVSVRAPVPSPARSASPFETLC